MYPEVLFCLTNGPKAKDIQFTITQNEKNLKLLLSNVQQEARVQLFTAMSYRGSNRYADYNRK